MLQHFLLESSIHGLKYLVEAKNVIFKLMWLCCITGCVLAAIIIIYLNITNWQSSPAVVTSVEPVPVKDTIAMPQITICPEEKDLGLMFYRMFTKYPQLITDTSLNHLMKASGMVALDMAFTQRKSFLTRNRSHQVKIFDVCHPTQANPSAQCQFVYLLTAIVSVDGEDHIQDYLLDRVVRGQRPTLESLESHIGEKTGRKMTINRRYPLLNHLNEHYKALKAYCQFFSVFQSQDMDTEEPLRALNEYDVNIALPEIKPDQFARLFLQLNERLAFSYGSQPQTVEVVTMAMDALTSHLRFSNWNETVNALDFYAYNYRQQPFFTTRSGKQKMTTGCEGLNVSQPCKDTLALELPSECSQYCLFMESIADQEAQILELYDMATYSADWNGQWSPKTFTPICRFNSLTGFKEAPCFKEVVTTHGKCLTLDTDLVPPLSDPEDEDYFTIIMFEGSSLGLDPIVPEKAGGRFSYKTYIESPHHYTWGKYSEDGSSLTMKKGDVVVNEYDLLISVRQFIKTTEEFQAMSWQSRGCFYPDEVQLKWFDKYSESSCFLECTWNHAKDICGCVPWFLKALVPISKTCEVFGNNCFRGIVDDRYNLLEKQCSPKCLSDCDQYFFEHEMKSSRRYMPPARYPTVSCQDQPHEVRNNLTCQFVENMANIFGPGLRSLVDQIAPVNFEQYVRRMRVTSKRRTALRISKTATVTIIDMISNIGGTLGLFCGFSILSGVEILYWLVTGIHQKMTKEFFFSRKGLSNE